MESLFRFSLLPFPSSSCGRAGLRDCLSLGPWFLNSRACSQSLPANPGSHDGGPVSVPKSSSPRFLSSFWCHVLLLLCLIARALSRERDGLPCAALERHDVPRILGRVCRCGGLRGLSSSAPQPLITPASRIVTCVSCCHVQMTSEFHEHVCRVFFLYSPSSLVEPGAALQCAIGLNKQNFVTSAFHMDMCAVQSEE